MTRSKIKTASITDDAVTTAKVNPAQTDITSVGTLTGLTVGSSSAGIFNLQGGSSTSSQVRFFDGGTARARVGVPTGQTYLSLSGSDSLTADVAITSGGNVGIGYTDPRHPLHIAYSETGSIPTNHNIGATAVNNNYIGFHNSSNSATYSGLALETRTSGAARWLIANEWKNTFLGDLVFRTRNGGSSGSEVVRFTSSGEVAIGASTPKTSASGVTQLQIGGSGSPAFITAETGTTNRVAISAGAYKPGTNWNSGWDYANSSGEAVQIGFFDGDVLFRYAASGTEDATITWSERMRIDGSTGNVGISTSAPVANLEIEDGGTSNAILTKITADDQNPYALMIGNDTYSATDTNAFGFVQRNDGTAYIYNAGGLRAAFHNVSGGVLSLEGGVVLGAGAANSTTANTLDVYEEGGWTPNIGGDATYHVQQATYTKIGRAVYVWFYLQINARNTSAQNLVYGLPFAPATSNQYLGMTYHSGMNVSVYEVHCNIRSDSTIRFDGHTSLSGTQASGLNIFVNGTSVIASGVYYTT